MSTYHRHAARYASRVPGRLIWLVHAPQEHPVWSYYSVSLAPLGELPGFPPAHLSYPDAQWELLVAVLQGGCLGLEAPIPTVANLPWPYLGPANLVVQFHWDTGEQLADQLLEHFVVQVVQGLSLDTDQRSVQLQVLRTLLARCGAESRDPRLFQP